jgi:hypothetical protein
VGSDIFRISSHDENSVQLPPAEMSAAIHVQDVTTDRRGVGQVHDYIRDVLEAIHLPVIAKRRAGCRLLLGLHELTYQGRNLICFGIKREVSCVEYVDLRVWYVLAIAFRLAKIEREIVLAPKNQKPWLRLL